MTKKQPAQTEAAPAAGDRGAQEAPGYVRVRILQTGGCICAGGAVLNISLTAAETLEKLNKARILGV